jgi:hypothetical protein
MSPPGPLAGRHRAGAWPTAQWPNRIPGAQHLRREHYVHHLAGVAHDRPRPSSRAHNPWVVGSGPTRPTLQYPYLPEVRSPTCHPDGGHPPNGRPKGDRQFRTPPPGRPPEAPRPAAFQDKLWRPNLEPLAELAAIRVVRCTVDTTVAHERIVRRVEENAQRAAHADQDLLKAIANGERPLKSWVPISLDVPTLTVDTTDGYEPRIEEIVAFAGRPVTNTAG